MALFLSNTSLNGTSHFSTLKYEAFYKLPSNKHFAQYREIVIRDKYLWKRHE